MDLPYLSVVRIRLGLPASSEISSVLVKRLGLIPYILGLLTFLARYPAIGGEDIQNARKNIHTGQPTDFWGGLSSIIYGHIPTFTFLNWETLIVASQITIVSVSMSHLSRLTRPVRTSHCLWLILLTYSSLIFSSQGTRDGLQFSLLLSGLALGLAKSKERTRTLRIATSLILLLLGITLRPWLGAALVPIIIYMSRIWFEERKLQFRITHKVVICILTTLIPIGLEQGLSASQNLRNSYPQQQVMIMDSAATYCWGINPKSAGNSLRALQLFSKNETIGKSICQFYRADTWLSLTKSSQPSNSNLNTDFWLIEAENKKSYKTLESIWISNIIHDPITYLQNKSHFFTKMILASEMRFLHVLNSSDLKTFLQGSYLIIYDSLLTIHAFSLLFVWLGFAIYSRYFQKRIFARRSLGSHLLAMSILWAAISTIAYIGSNGRYTYSATLLLLVFSSFVRQEKERE